MSDRTLHRIICLVTLSLGFMTPILAEENTPINFADVNWQTAERTDMSVFEPYIGTFRGKSFNTDADGTEYYFTVTYEWYDRARSIVKYSVLTHFPATSESRPFSEGYYSYDPFSERIAVFSAFRDGRVGSGYLSSFDKETHYREGRLHTKMPNGDVIEIRDTYWIIDNESSGTRTFISANGAEWRMVSDGVYTRVLSKH